MSILWANPKKDMEKDLTPEEIRRRTHITHCCILHGCKYGDVNCVVVTRQEKQAYTCEDCGLEGFTTIPDPDSPEWEDQNEVLVMDHEDLMQEVLMLRKIIKDANLVI
jgi:hypothetical protein